MKAITLTQPWATLVAIGAKRYETRSWNTVYTGPIAIHAAKGLSSVGGKRGLHDLCRTEPFRSVITEEMIHLMPLGRIVAVANIVGCFRSSTVDADLPIEPAEHERDFGDWHAGRYVYALDNVVELTHPRVARGQLGLWNVPDAMADHFAALLDAR
jgi:activating signal cointegrator 1